MTFSKSKDKNSLAWLSSLSALRKTEEKISTMCGDKTKFFFFKRFKTRNQKQRTQWKSTTKEKFTLMKQIGSFRSDVKICYSFSAMVTVNYKQLSIHHVKTDLTWRLAFFLLKSKPYDAKGAKVLRSRITTKYSTKKLKKKQKNVLLP